MTHPLPASHVEGSGTILPVTSVGLKHYSVPFYAGELSGLSFHRAASRADFPENITRRLWVFSEATGKTEEAAASGEERCPHMGRFLPLAPRHDASAPSPDMSAPSPGLCCPSLLS